MGGNPAMRLRIILSPLIVVALSSCATLNAPEESLALSQSAGLLSSAMSDMELARATADVEAYREAYRDDMHLGLTAKFETSCYPAMKSVKTEFLLNILDPVAADASFAKILTVPLCTIPSLARVETNDPPSTTNRIQGLRRVRIDMGVEDLEEAGAALRDYADALATIASGELAGKSDAARDKLVTAGSDLLAALKVPPASAPILSLVNEGASAVLAARRNAVTRDFLARMDPIMPDMMEQLGNAARHAVVDAATNRASAAQRIASAANKSLNQPALLRQVRSGTYSAAGLTRATQYDAWLDRLDRQNSALAALRQSDPMRVTRHFAAAHHDLRQVFEDPRAERTAVFESLARLRVSVTALADSLDKAKASTN